MGRQEQRARQKDLWIAHTGLAVASGVPVLPSTAGVTRCGEVRCVCQSTVHDFLRGKYGCALLAHGIYCRCFPVEYILKASGTSVGPPVTAEFAAHAAELLPNDTAKVSIHVSL